MEPVVAVESVTGVRDLWSATRGDRRIRVAILDGPVDRGHPSFAGANTTCVETLVACEDRDGPGARHGTHIASVILGRGTVHGLAPHCEGLIVPVFPAGEGSELPPCSELDLAVAILLAVERGAHVLNISGGQFAPTGESHPLLAGAVRYCADRNVLVVAAAGNDGCNCLHVPAALPLVLAVGAMDMAGNPLDHSNWGDAYRAQGILAPGEGIGGALPGGGVTAVSGTSVATAVVSGIALLLLSLQLKLGRAPDPRAVRNAILNSARGCNHRAVPDCRRLLVGRLDVKGAMSLILQGDATVSNFSADPQPSSSSDPAESTPLLDTGSPPSTTTLRGSVTPAASPEVQGARHVSPSSCGCSCGSGEARSNAQFGFAIGQLGFDYGSEARRDSIAQHMAGPTAADAPSPHDARHLLAYLATNPWEAASINWILQLDATPIYAVRPDGPFAAEAFRKLRDFLGEGLDEGVERVSIPGIISGKARLLTGQVVPVIRPELRGMYSWSTAALVQALVKPSPDAAKAKTTAPGPDQPAALTNFLERVYHQFRNLGITPQDRAINYTATHAFSTSGVLESALKEEMELDTVEIEKSVVCRPESECWDVKFFFFYPQRQVQTVRKVYRLTVDVSDVVPVAIGPVRSWFAR